MKLIEFNLDDQHINISRVNNLLINDWRLTSFYAVVMTHLSLRLVITTTMLMFQSKGVLSISICNFRTIETWYEIPPLNLEVKQELITKIASIFLLFSPMDYPTSNNGILLTSNCQSSTDHHDTRRQSVF